MGASRLCENYGPRIAKATVGMHFSKTYSQLLLTLSPPELRESAIEYRRLKKIINRIVPELTVLSPSACPLMCSLR